MFRPDTTGLSTPLIEDFMTQNPVPLAGGILNITDHLWLQRHNDNTSLVSLYDSYLKAGMFVI